LRRVPYPQSCHSLIGCHGVADPEGEVCKQLLSEVAAAVAAAPDLAAGVCPVALARVPAAVPADEVTAAVPGDLTRDLAGGTDAGWVGRGQTISHGVAETGPGSR
jgi:hypothetical protein